MSGLVWAKSGMKNEGLWISKLKLDLLLSPYMNMLSSNFLFCDPKSKRNCLVLKFHSWNIKKISDFDLHWHWPTPPELSPLRLTFLSFTNSLKLSTMLQKSRKYRWNSLCCMPDWNGPHQVWRQYYDHAQVAFYQNCRGADDQSVWCAYLPCQNSLKVCVWNSSEKGSESVIFALHVRDGPQCKLIRRCWRSADLHQFREDGVVYFMFSMKFIVPFREFFDYLVIPGNQWRITASSGNKTAAFPCVFNPRAPPSG